MQCRCAQKLKDFCSSKCRDGFTTLADKVYNQGVANKVHSKKRQLRYPYLSSSDTLVGAVVLQFHCYMVV